MRETLVFFRDDDVGEMSEPLRGVMDTLLEASVPCNYQVVPEYLDAAAVPELKRLQTGYSDLIFLNQHGLRHCQEIDGEQVATEFAGGRSFESQFQDIQQGREMLAAALGDSFSPDVFTPPCHKYDGTTLRALGALGFKTLSAGVRGDWVSRIYYAVGRQLGRVELLGKRVSYHLRVTPDPRLCEVSAAIDVHEDIDRARNRLDKTADELWQEFEIQRTRLSVVGIMLHHQACDTPDKRIALRDFVVRLKQDPGVRFVTMGELAASAAGL
jgi:hypothetical protein